MSAVTTHGKAGLTQPEVCRPVALDTLANAWRARSTGGLSPAAGLLAWYDWALHLSLPPGKQRSLIEKGLHKQQRLARYALRVASTHDCPTCIEPLAVREDVRQKIIDAILVGRLGQPDEIAALVAFIARPPLPS